MTALYTAEALSTGDGRNGHVATGDGLLDVDVRTPVEMGGAGGALNPELLFAAGYAACFHSALLAVARRDKVQIHDTSVGSRVSLVRTETGLTLAVELEVVIPDLPRDQAQALADGAYQMCPYSNATRGNIETTVTVVED
ncbi:MAG: organic hydroperoxide resistance protein [Microbacterium sp.]|uniref:organic hydroperoxide resistance protein n=1 Tax=Microbacterium sp. TaxID=51671 RepID=UPI0026018968|nr:organic hydroperoxide resistance protein [Microbacterium sp.]MCX6503320.1 organic hydroperoxide resistance protein [Microbacterium sp.]